MLQVAWKYDAKRPIPLKFICTLSLAVYSGPLVYGSVGYSFMLLTLMCSVMGSMQMKQVSRLSI